MHSRLTRLRPVHIFAAFVGFKRLPVLSPALSFPPPGTAASRPLFKMAATEAEPGYLKVNISIVTAWVQSQLA